jgi:DNA-binding NarL/FixJ family response regulator
VDIKLLIVDDHSMVREGLIRMLAEDPSFGLISEAKNGLTALMKAREMNPDVVIMDYDMPHYNGIYGTRELLKEQPNAKVLMLSMFQTKEFIMEAIQVGVKGFIMKEASSDELIAAVKAVYNGETWFKGPVAEIITPYLIAHTTGQHRGNSQKNLSSRELEVLCLFAEGLTAKDIALKLEISKRTVEVHKAKVFKKLNIHNTAELIRYAVKHNLIKIP